MTTGSIVESVAAFVGPTRSRPAKKVTTARTVEMSATPLTDAQPNHVVGKDAPLIAMRPLYITAAEVIITVEDGIAVPCSMILLPTRI